MLVLSRKRDESIMIGENVEVTVVDVRGDVVKLGVRAPRSVAVHRKEVFESIQRENIAAAKASQTELARLIQVVRERHSKGRRNERENPSDA
jgi:carbon storage regulator